MGEKLTRYSVHAALAKDPTRSQRIGTAFGNRDGTISVHLDSLPMDGKLKLREEVRPVVAPRGVE